MIRFVAREPLAPSNAASGRRLANPDLLLEIADKMRNAGADDYLADCFSYTLHDLRMAGTWKRTNRGRLGATERAFGTYLNPGPEGTIIILDLGASDGVTTLELVAALRQKFGDRIAATVADLNLFLLRYRRGPIYEYRATDGEPIMVRLGRFGLRLSTSRQQQGGRSDVLGALYLACRAVRGSMRLDARISLVNPLVEVQAGVTAIELNCLDLDQTLVDRFTAVRASNVLNLGYFSPAQLRMAVGNIHRYLRESGCVVISRNRDVPGGEVEDGSVWRKTGPRFTHLEDFGAGSEIREIVDGCGS